MLITKLPWPLPAVLVWLAAWCVFFAIQQVGIGPNSAFAIAAILGALMSVLGSNWWRKIFIAGGFPFSLFITSASAAHMPAWTWLIPVLILLAIYPVRVWKDAPLFPTPVDTLIHLNSKIYLSDGAKIMDAGCGLGHGLQALRNAYPTAELTGVEWSRPLYWACQLRCPWAKMLHANIWSIKWSDYDLVYLFQRPESMQRAADKASKELKTGAWLVSLEFEAEALVATAHLKTSSGKMLWLYQAPLKQK